MHPQGPSNPPEQQISAVEQQCAQNEHHLLSRQRNFWKSTKTRQNSIPLEPIQLAKASKQLLTHCRLIRPECQGSRLLRIVVFRWINRMSFRCHGNECGGMRMMVRTGIGLCVECLL